MSANAPYGTTYTSPAPPLFSTPFVTAATGQNLGQDFPVTLAPLNSSASHPDSNINWSQFEPITGLPNYPTDNRIPYTEEYMLSMERGLGANTVLSCELCGHAGASASGAGGGEPRQSRALPVLQQSRQPGARANPVRTLRRRTILTRLSTGQIYNGTRGPLGPNFGSDANQATIGNSNYNALQITLRHTSGHLNLLAGYTYSKSQDQSSNIGEEVNPLDPSLSKALSAFDMRHNFVVSYSYQIPFETSVPCLEPLDARLGIFRDHALQQRAAGDARQLRRQFPAWAPNRTASITMAWTNRITRRAPSI